MSRRRARRLRAATAVVAVAAAFAVGASCDGRRQPGRDAGIITLLDLIPDSAAAGPWALLAVRDYRRDPARRPKESPGLSEEVSLNPGRTVLVRLTYSKRWGRGRSVEARLVSAGRPVTAISGPLGKSWCELRLHNPSLSSGTLEILHSGVTGDVPLQSMVVLESRGSVSPAEERRAHALLYWAGRAPRPEARAVLSRRKFGLVRGGFLRSALALVGADTVSFELPHRTGRVRLRCWVVGLRVMEGGRPLLRAEVLDERGWSLIHRWDRVDLDESAWRQTDTDPWITPHAQKLRFVTTGDEDVLALGSPILIPETDHGSLRKNVILIDLDTMRSDRLGCYGYQVRDTSARLDSLIDDRGFFVFRSAHSAGPWTLPATAKFMTSRYRNIDRNGEVPTEYTTLAETLGRAGYYCAAFTGGGVLRSRGFEQGFHQYFWSEELGDILGKVESVFPHVQSWLGANDLSPFFLFVHTYEPHTPYNRDTFCRDLARGRLGDLSLGEGLLPVAAFGDERFPRLTPSESLYVQAAYDGGVKTACDATVDLLRSLDRDRLWDNTLVVILSDHGEEFWEHSRLFAEHSVTSLHGEVISVPFLLHDPAFRREGATHIHAPVSTVDVLPTVCQLAGVRTGEPCDGVSLSPLLRGEDLVRHIPIMAFTHPGDKGWPVRSCVVADGWKYIEPVRANPGQDWEYAVHEQLYRVAGDPGETEECASNLPDQTRRAAERLRDGLTMAAPLVAHTQDRGEPADSAALQAQLRALGYVRSE